VTYELGVNLKYKGNPIDPADIGFDNPQFDFHGGSDDPTWTAVADIDSLAGRLENYQNYNIVNTEAHYDYTWLTINVMTYGAEMYQYGGAAANQSSAKIQRTYGDPLNLVGTVASWSINNIDPAVKQMIETTVANLTSLKEGVQWPLDAGFHEDVITHSDTKFYQTFVLGHGNMNFGWWLAEVKR